MLSPSAATIRLFLHIIAASVWVGGQFALAGIVPTLRRVAPDSTKAVAQAFSRVAWTAFGITVLTGMWNLMAIDITATGGSYQGTVLLHIGLAMASGAFVVVHQLGQTKLALALGGALGALFSVIALFVGILLRTGS